MLPLLADIHDPAPQAEARGAARRTLELAVASSGGNALIHNLSQTGLLIQTAAALAVGDRIEIDLPEVGPTPAHVIWTQREFVGCEFAAPVSRAAVSAALLKAVPETAPPLPAVARAPWSDLAIVADAAPEAAASPALAAGLIVSLGIAAALVVALLSFPFAV